MPELPPPPLPVARAALGLRRALLRAADALLPPQFAVFDRSIGVGRTQVAGALAELAVPDALGDGRATAEDLAPRVGVDADALHRLLRAAAVEGLVRMDGRGRVRLTRMGRALRSDDPHSMRDWARYMAHPSTVAAWAGLADSVRTGRSAFARVHGAPVWDWFAEHPEVERLFAGAMRRLTEEDVAVVVPAYPWPEHGVVCDVAGGVGTLLAGVLRARPGLRGVLVDLPGVLAEAEAHLSGAGLRDRVELVAGNLFEGIEAQADVYLLKNILHDWDDPTCARILRTVAATMPSGARLVVVEQLQERNEPEPFASLSDLQMLTQCVEGRERSVAELQELLAGAGLRAEAVRRTATQALVEAVAP